MPLDLNPLLLTVCFLKLFDQLIDPIGAWPYIEPSQNRLNHFKTLEYQLGYPY
jgi:hypothetical protein